jgi:hypothetical protein
VTAAVVSEAFSHRRKPPWREVAAHIDERYGAAVVLAQEGWVSGPLDYYRKSGPVWLWSQRDEREEGNQRVLFGCRPSRCSNVGGEARGSRPSLVMEWRWGDPRGGQGELRLYEISDVNN